MKWPYPVGTKVKINDLGFEFYQEGFDNPRGVSGVVTKIENLGDEESWVWVKWDNGQHNAYGPGTLDRAKPMQLENK